MIKVVVVDDSSFMRRAIGGMIEEAEGLELVGTGRNGAEAIELAKTLKPDVMTLDIEMPEMDGLTALRVIMRECPTKVLMCSSLTTEGSVASLRALRIGAASVIAKDHSTFSTKMGEMKDDLLELIREIGRSKGRFIAKPAGGAGAKSSEPVTGTPVLPRTIAPLSDVGVVAIGSSTGGPPVLESLLEGLPADYPFPIVIAQHMPEVFTASMVKRLDATCKIEVVHGDAGEELRPGRVVIAHGGHHYRVAGRPRAARLERVENEREVYKPSVNILLESCGKVYGSSALGIVLTGIGRDGAEGAKVIKSAGGTVLAQNEATSVVYGMPRAVVEDGTAVAAMAPEEILAVLLASAEKRAAA
ncbi:protein-glutamate methylesterase/protein-glutamine glutaminase [Mucisphaera sp.]|uniref:protein-glutamate methylesterase/protein-glutamine glutaminase n=1 Tax=Mucisphaera sp. TaxID=2913024 RepID=UPI003D117219